MTSLPHRVFRGGLALLSGLAAGAGLQAHHDTAPLRPEEVRMADGSVTVAGPVGNHAHVRLLLRDAATQAPVAGLIRVTPCAESATPLQLAGLFERPAGWFSMPAEATLALPPGRHLIEATCGIDTLIAVKEVECLPGGAISLTLAPERFHDLQAGGWQAVNTHLHLLLRSHLKMGIDLKSRREADDYLGTIGASDRLDLVYVTHLYQQGANEILSNDYTESDLAELSRGPARLAGGLEHRHGGVRIQTGPPTAGPPATTGGPVYTQDNSRVAMTYGHVLLLGRFWSDLAASVGPGLGPDPAASDGVPLRTAMRVTQERAGAVVWCHGSFGLEWIPSWFSGALHAQNIYDGGSEGTFETVHYPLLNAGLRVPFSAGTDWGVWDFARVYVASPQPLDHAGFLRELTAGRTYITNEPLLEFSVQGTAPGSTIAVTPPGTLRIRGRALGRSDFIRLQVVHNGRVVQEAACRPAGRHYAAEIDFSLEVTEPGWLALRVAPEMPYSIRSRYTGRGVNILGKAIFAHTSPVYVTVAGRSAADPAAVAQLLARLDAALRSVDELGSFRDPAERESLRRVYLEAMTALRAQPAVISR